MSRCDKCCKKATWVTKGGESQACASHKGADMVSFDKLVCVDLNCHNRPRYAFPDMDRPHYCKVHKLAEMIDVVHKRCWAPKCKGKPGFAYPGQASFRCFCKDHREPEMQPVKDDEGACSDSSTSSPAAKDLANDHKEEAGGRASKRPRKGEVAASGSEAANGGSSRGGGGTRGRKVGAEPPLGRRSTRVAGPKDEVLSLEQAQADNGLMWSVKEVAWVQHDRYPMWPVLVTKLYATADGEFMAQIEFYGGRPKDAQGKSGSGGEDGKRQVGQVGINMLHKYEDVFAQYYHRKLSNEYIDAVIASINVHRRQKQLSFDAFCRACHVNVPDLRAFLFRYPSICAAHGLILEKVKKAPRPPATTAAAATNGTT